MNRVSSLALWVMGVVLFFSFGVTRSLAQAAQPATPAAAPQQDQAQKPATSPSDNDAQKRCPKKDAEESEIRSLQSRLRRCRRE